MKEEVMEVFQATLISGGSKKAQVVVHHKDDDGVIRSATRHVVCKPGSDRFVGNYPNDAVIARNKFLNEAAGKAVATAEGTIAVLDYQLKRYYKVKEAIKNRIMAAILQDRIDKLENMLKLAKADLKTAELELVKVLRENPYPISAEFEF